MMNPASSDWDRSPGRITLLVAEAAERMEKALKNVQERSMEYGPWMISSKKMREFQKRSKMMLHLKCSPLKLLNPQKHKFSALIVTQDYYHFRNHQMMLTGDGNWDVKWAQSGESTFASYHPSEFCFDLIIIHHDLPGMDGPTVARLCSDLKVPSVIFGVSTTVEGGYAFFQIGFLCCHNKPTGADAAAEAEAMLEAIREAEIYYYVGQEFDKLRNIGRNLQRLFFVNPF